MVLLALLLTVEPRTFQRAIYTLSNNIPRQAGYDYTLHFILLYKVTNSDRTFNLFKKKKKKKNSEEKQYYKPNDIDTHKRSSQIIIVRDEVSLGKKILSVRN